MDSIQKIYRLLVLIIIGFIAVEILPFLAPIIGMLVFSFLFTTIFLQAVDSLERRIRSRTISVFMILSTTIMIGLMFIGSFISNLGLQIKLFTQNLKLINFWANLRNLYIILI